MSRSLRRGAVAALALAIAPVLAACAASENAATLQVKPNIAATSVGSLKLNGIAIVEGGNGSANVTANIANWASQADTLTSVSVDGQNATLTGPTDIAAGGSLQLGSGTTATLTGFTGQAGADAPVTFQFRNGGSVTVPALVNTAQSVYSSYAPTAAATSASPAASASASASAPASASASASSSASVGAKKSSSPSASATKH